MANIHAPQTKIGICTFSCHRHWQAVRDKSAATKFHDAQTYFEHAKDLGGDGIQTGIHGLTTDQIAKLRERIEESGGYYEGDIRLPAQASDLERFEMDVRAAKAAGATVARACLTGSRRYETWKTRSQFDDFVTTSKAKLHWIEPILAKHAFKIGIENHKDLTSAELVDLLREIASPWIGVNVDTGNNIALAEDPYETIERLAPFAVCVHIKDMAVQPAPQGFLLSEVPCGAGCLDLSRICSTLLRSNPNLNFSLEMATRDPLVVPCLNESYWVTFPDRRQTAFDRIMKFVHANPIKQPPPSIQGLAMDRQLADEESNNRLSIDWLKSRRKIPS